MTAPASEILCVGAAHWDVIGRADRSVKTGDDVPGKITRRPGGVAMNVALGLAAHGRPVSLCTVVGRDSPGDALIRHAEAAGIDCTHVLWITDGETGTYMAIEDGAGALVAAVADAGLLDAQSAAVAERVEIALSHATAVFVDANLPAASVRRIAGWATDAGIEIIANSVSPAKAVHLACLLTGRHCPTIVINLGEANVLSNEQHETAKKAAFALVQLGARAAFVTDGPHEAALVTADSCYTSIPADLPPGAPVTGAGDALLAGFLASQHRHADPRAAMEFALAAAATHMTKGA